MLTIRYRIYMMRNVIMKIWEDRMTTLVDDRVKRREELVAKAQSLHPLLAKNANEAERRRRLPDENFRAIVDADLMRILIPRTFGGLETDHRTYLDVTMALARSGCGSTAWYSFILNMADWLTGMMPDEVQQAVWGKNPNARACCPLNPSPGWKYRREKNGVRLSGEWGYASGCHHSEWAMPGFPIPDDNGGILDFGLGWIPIHQATIKDTWHVIGMCGTASDTLVLDDVFIPDNFILHLSDILRGKYPNVPKDGYLYRADAAAVFWTCVCPPVYGLAQAALDLTIERLTSKPKPATYTLYRDVSKAPSAQSAVARAAIMIDAAVLQARAAADEIDEQSRNGGNFTTRTDRHRQYMRTANAVRLCKGAVDLLLDAQGAGSFALNNPMQRIWRDLNIAARHGFNVPGIKEEVFGRTLLKADEQQMTAIL
jgi:3-hydroxy-9,10-secoandrosta-1,3,5(10)-triene-9,17-dione monooxygenase